VLIDLVIFDDVKTAIYWDGAAQLASPTVLEIALLLCQTGTDRERLVAICIRRCGDGYHARHGPQMVHVTADFSDWSFAKLEQRRGIHAYTQPGTHLITHTLHSFLLSIESPLQALKAYQSTPAAGPPRPSNSRPNIAHFSG
jgi:hypothetical protein